MLVYQRVNDAEHQHDQRQVNPMVFLLHAHWSRTGSEISNQISQV